MAATAEQRSFQANRPGGLRSGLLSGCAIAAVAMTAPAHGQAFNGTITSSVNASQTATTTTTSTITVSARNALVNWTTSTPTTFLPTGNTVTYTNAGTTATDREFTVLNVVNSTTPITLNGTVNSLFNGTTGGKVWFYNPGGIIAGPNAVFNVGGLLLTSNAINFDTGYGSYDNGYGTGNNGYGSYVDLFQGTQTATGGIIHFAGAQSDGKVTISGLVAGVGGGPGAVINANTAANSYVALVAPRVSQGGTVNVDGSAAYLALASADVNINAGLFDISNGNLEGTQPATSGETTLTHSGTTNVTTPANTTDAPRNIYLVAIPKNDAVTMLVGGTLGYAAATNATAVNGKIILDAGGTPIGDSFNAPDLGLAGNVTSTAATFNAPVVVNATGNANLQASTGDLIFRYGVDITSYGDLAELAASGTHTLDVGEYPAAAPTSNAVVRNVSGGTARVAASGGSTLNIRHDLLVSAEDPFDGAPSATKTAELTVAGTGTQATVGGTLTIDASKGFPATGSDQSAVGGTASIDVSGGSLTVTGATTLDAFGTGETGYAATNLDGIGGLAQITASGGIVTLAAVSLDASASAGRNNESSDVGTATGGRNATTGGAFIASTGGAITISGATSLDASAAGVFANTAVQGGDVGISASGGAVTVTGTTTTLTSTAAAGLATGGNASIATLTGGTVGLKTTTVNVNGTSYGEDGEGAGYTGQGGTIAVGANGGTITLTGPLTATANGTGANFRTNGGGDGRGGSAIISAQGGGVVNLAAATVNADGRGGDGFPNTQGGTGYGGVAAIDLDGGGLVATLAVTLTANGTGGTDASPATPGDGYGGTARVTAANSSSTQKAAFGGALTLQANGFGGEVSYGAFDPAPGGDGFGGGIFTGTSGVVVHADTGGIISVTGRTTLQANGTGGLGAAGGNGGIGTGGSLDVATIASGGTAGTITLADLSAATDGFGGDAETGYGALGGVGFGGGAAGSGSTGVLIRALGGGTINAFSIGLSSTGTGGLGGSGADFDEFQGSGTTGGAGGAGGNGVGGAVAVTSGGNLLISSGFGIQTDGVGGVGGDGGQTEGGYGAGGVGGAGGNGTGGLAAISATGGIIRAVGSNVTADGRRASGGGGGSGDTTGGAGAAGVAAGGSIALTVSDTSTSGSAALGGTTLYADGLDNDTSAFTGSAGVITIAVTGQASDALSFGALEISADGTTAGSNPSFSLIDSGQAILAPNGIFISTTGNANFAFSNAGALRATNNSLTVSATGIVTTTNTSSATSVLYGAGDTTIDAAQIIGGSFESLNGDLELTGPNGVTGVTGARAGDSITASAENGAVDITTLIAGTGPHDEDFNGAIGVIALNNVTLGTATAYGAIGILSLSGGVSATSIAAGQRTDDSVSTDDAAILGAGPIQVGSVIAPGRLYVGGPGSINLSQVDLDDPTTAQVIAALAAAPTASGSSITIGTADSGSAQINAGTSLTLSNSLTTRTGDATLHAASNVAGGGALNIFGALNLSADAGSIAIGRLDAGGNATLTSGTSATTGDFGVGGSLSVATDDGAITIGNGQAGTDLTLLAYSNLNPGDIRAGNITAGRDVFIEDIYTGGSNGSQSRSATLGNVTAGDDILIGEFGPVTAGTLRTTGLGQDGTAPPTSFASNLQGSSVSVFSGSDITIAAIQSAGSIGLTVQGLTDQATGYAVSTGIGTISVGSTIAATTVTARDVLGAIDLRGIIAPGGVTATGTSVALAGAGDLRVTNAQATAGNLVLSAIGSLQVDAADASGDFSADAGGIVTVPALDIGGVISISGTAGVSAQNLVAGSDIDVASTGGTVATGAVTSGGGIALSGANGVTTQALQGAGAVMLTSSAGGVTSGNATSSGGAVMMRASGALSTQTVQAARSITLSSTTGTLGAGTVTSSGGTVRINAAGNIGVGDVTAAGSVILSGAAAIDAGNLSAGVGTLLPGEAGSGSIDNAPAGIAAGFDGTAVDQCDDCATGAITLPFTVDYFGNSYSTTYVSNNGYVTFNFGQGSFTPDGLGTGYSGQPIIAAFFADVDTRNAISALTRYGNGTYAGRNAFGATWNGVGYYPGAADKLNNFQIILTDRSDTGAGNFDIYFNYTAINWETGSASGGSNGFGGVSAAVGYNAGISGNPTGTYFELPGSRVPGSFLNNGTSPLITTSNTGNPGQLLFTVRNGQVVTNSEPPTVRVNNIAAGNTAAITVGNVSGEAVDIHGAGTVTTGTVDVADRGSGIAATGLPFATSIQATGNLVTGTVNGTGSILLGSDTADVSTGSISSGASVGVLANGNVVLGQVTTGTGATDALFIGGPDALGDGTLASYVAGNTDASSLATLTPTRVGGTIQFGGPVSTGNLIAAAVGDITLGSATVTNLLSLDTAGTARLSGQIGGPTLRVSSSDVVIDTSGETAIGNGTTLLEFTNNGTRGTYVGGGDVSDAWSLSNNEFGRLSAATITFNAPDIAQNDADLTIGDLDIIGGAGTATATRRQNLTTSQLIFNSAGSALVNGAVTMTGTATDDLLAINAVDLLRVITPTGSIKLTGADGALGGTLKLTGNVVFVGSQQAATDIAGMTDITQRSTRLGQNDGEANNAGYIQANGLQVSVDSGFYVQNTGTSGGAPDTRAGFSVGNGGIDFSTGEDDVEVAINGRIDRGGTVLTGAGVLSALFAQNDDLSVNVVDGSTINGCVIGASSCGGIAVPNEVTQINDILNQLTLLSSQTPDPFQFTFQSPQLISFGDLSPLTLAPLIDEPVTGAGNDDLWAGIGYGTEPNVEVIGDGDGDPKKKKMKP